MSLHVDAKTVKSAHISFSFSSPPASGERLGEGEVKDAQITRARELRRDGTKPERICWELLRDRRLSGIKFRRQHPIGPYFADFACVSEKLVIEIDGEHHGLQVERDARRTAFMEHQGWRPTLLSKRSVRKPRGDLDGNRRCLGGSPLT